MSIERDAKNKEIVTGLAVPSRPSAAAAIIGSFSLALGVLAILGGLVPYVGLLAVPVAMLGGALAVVGLLLAAFGKGGCTMPVAGAVACVLGIGTALATTTYAHDALSGGLAERPAPGGGGSFGEAPAAAGGKRQETMSEASRESARKAAYIANGLVLYGVSASYMNSILDGKVPGVDFKLRNTGAETLDKVEVTFYFMDAKGVVIHEETFLPVLVGAFLSDSRPLKPGYVWQMERGHFYSAKSVPGEWAEGRVKAAVTDIRFASSAN